MVNLTFPDGSVREYDDGVRGVDVAEGISKSLAKKAVAMKLNGELADLADPIAQDAKIEIVTRTDDDALELIRHDAAHVMAEAVQELFPGTQVTIGPVITDGFYYDFARDEPFTTEDLELIEKKMAEIIDRNASFTKEVWSRDVAKKHFSDKGESYKVELVDAIPEGARPQDLPSGRLARFVPWTAHGFHRSHWQGLQTDEGGRCLLAWRFQQCHVEPHLRDGMGKRERSQSPI